EVGARFRFPKERNSDALSSTLIDRQFMQSGSERVTSVEIVCGWVATLMGRLEVGDRERIHVLRHRWPQRARLTSYSRVAGRDGFALLEERENVIVSPARCALRFPGVEVRAPSPEPDEPIDA